MAKKEEKEAIKNYLDNLPIFKLSIMASIFEFFKKILEKSSKNFLKIENLCSSFSSCFFKCSANFRTLEYQIKIPPASDEESKFLLKAFHLLDVEKVFLRASSELDILLKRKLKERKNSTRNLETEVEFKRLFLENWDTFSYMEENVWLTPTVIILFLFFFIIIFHFFVFLFLFFFLLFLQFFLFN